MCWAGTSVIVSFIWKKVFLYTIKERDYVSTFCSSPHWFQGFIILFISLIIPPHYPALFFFPLMLLCCSLSSPGCRLWDGNVLEVSQEAPVQWKETSVRQRGWWGCPVVSTETWPVEVLELGWCSHCLQLERGGHAFTFPTSARLWTWAVLGGEHELARGDPLAKAMCTELVAGAGVLAALQQLGNKSSSREGGSGWHITVSTPSFFARVSDVSEWLGGWVRIFRNEKLQGRVVRSLRNGREGKSVWNGFCQTIEFWHWLLLF